MSGVASLGSLANEVSVIYGLKPNPGLVKAQGHAQQDEEVKYSMDRLYALRSSALTGATTAALTMGLTHNSSRPATGTTGSGSGRRSFSNISAS